MLCRATRNKHGNEPRRFSVNLKLFLLAVFLVGTTATARAADVGVSVSVGQPGFYGRLDIGDFPRPQILYSQPRMIRRGPSGRPPVPCMFLRGMPGTGVGTVPPTMPAMNGSILSAIAGTTMNTFRVISSAIVLVRPNVTMDGGMTIAATIMTNIGEVDHD
jgi:hypothetical protein